MLFSKTTVCSCDVEEMTSEAAEIIQKITRVNVPNYFPPPVLFRCFDIQLVRSPEGLSGLRRAGSPRSVLEVNTYGTFKTLCDRPGQRRVSARSQSEPDVARSLFGPLKRRWEHNTHTHTHRCTARPSTTVRQDAIRFIVGAQTK